MTTVLLAPDAQREFDALPRPIQARVLAIVRRLVDWPNVSGVKWLRGPWSGYGRIRTGDYRLLFTFVQPGILVVRILHRKDVYEQ